MAKDRTEHEGEEAFHRLLHNDHQSHGALGVLNAVAHMLGVLRARDRNSDANRLEEALARVVEADRSPVGALGLASLAELSPSSAGRVEAGRLLASRRHQLSGLARTFSETTVGAAIAVSDEYRDGEVVCMELKVGGRYPLTLVADRDRVWAQREARVDVFNRSLAETVAAIELERRNGSPRRVELELSETELRRVLWFLAYGDRVAVGFEIGFTYLQWTIRLLGIETTTWAGLPAVETDQTIDDSELVDSFRASTFGQNWSQWAYDELLDHVVHYELGGEVPPLCWSPRRVAHLLTSGSGSFDGDHAAALPALLRSWVAYCANRTGQRMALLKPILAEIDTCSSDFYRDLGDRGAA